MVGHLRNPLLMPDEEERHGYVPNVVCSCGSPIHGDRLVIAYGAARRDLPRGDHVPSRIRRTGHSDHNERE